MNNAPQNVEPHKVVKFERTGGKNCDCAIMAKADKWTMEKNAGVENTTIAR